MTLPSNSNNEIDFIERFLSAFKTIGGNEDGLIDYEHFKNQLHQKNAAETKDILHLINAERHVRDGKLHFVSLCLSVLATKAAFNCTFENGKVSIPTSRINSRTFTRNKGANKSPYQALEVDKDPTLRNFYEVNIRGLLFNINNDILSYRYRLEVSETSTVTIVAKALSSDGDYLPQIPIEVLVFQDGKTKTLINSLPSSDDGYCAVNVTLKKGKYILIPILLKWDVIGKSNSFDSLNLDSLIHIEEDSTIKLTKATENALKMIFDCIDLDGNRLLSQSEFDFFIRHISGESATEEWTTIEDNFQTANHQLTFDGFLELYRMVLQTDPTDVMNMLQHMGLNESLQLENAQPFRLVIKSDTDNIVLSPLPIASYKEVADNVLRKVAIEQGSAQKTAISDVFLFTHHLTHRLTVVIQNQSPDKVALKLDCTRSTNCQSDSGSLDTQIEIPPKSSVVAFHVFPVDSTRPWNFEYTEVPL